MKRYFSIALALALMLTGCAEVQPPRPEQESPAPAVGAPLDSDPEIESEAAGVQIEHGMTGFNMALELPEGWNSAIRTSDTGNSIRFWPTAVSDGSEEGGRLSLQFTQELFGVCGTGLESEELLLDSVHKVSVGTYDGGPVWSFIAFQDTPGSYVIMNEGADSWWSEYETQAMQIIHSIRVGEGYLTESEAVERAKEACTVDYNRIRPTFDAQTGGWSVLFYRDYTAGGDQTVRLDKNGTVAELEYGE